EEAARLVLECKGRTILSGMGKPGLIGQKISATLASTGTPSYSLHPAEALHGDLGRIVKEDVILILSNSGETEEIVRLIPHVKKIGAKIIGMTGRKDSTLARHSDILLDMGDVEEACPLGLAPTTSTSVMLALGDALALAVQRGRNFTLEEYATNHPGGSLGRRFLRVEEIMRKESRLARIPASRTVKEAIFAITEARSGAACVVDDQGRLVGVFTDGDLRRHMAREERVLEARVADMMTRNPTTITAGRLAVEAMRIMGEKKFNQLPVVDEGRRPIGTIDIQDLAAIGFIS
ncbi:MAG TPA: KpsF/GutQ family sugar-phosphate isomerase, partial [Planctomycetota bacterium]|nr:KpsF/GutQ family sugar-phosphate isomerase [Planctomycetota bacterium]